MQEHTITTERPKVQRVYIVARDPDSGKSKSTTVYNASPEAVIGAIEAMAKADEKPSRRRAS